MNQIAEPKPHHRAQVPQAVREAEERASAMMSPPAAQPEAGGGAGEGGGGAGPVTPGATPHAAPDAGASAPAAAAPPNFAPPIPGPAAPPAETNWEHRYQSLHGKHQQEVAAKDALAAQVGTLNDDVNRLHRVIAGMGAASPPAGGTITEGAGTTFFTPEELSITEQERADYGDEFLSVAAKAAAAKLAKPLTDLMGRLSQVEQRITGVASVVAADAWTEAQNLLSREVPDWLSLNVDVGFLNWLKETDAFAGVTRKQLLDNAVAANDGRRIAAFFKAFKGVTPTIGGPSPPANPQPPAAPAAPARTSLETLAAPGRGAGGTPTGSPQVGDAPAFTRAEIAAFYTDVSRGRFRGRDAERSRIEAEIDRANREGRILP